MTAEDIVRALVAQPGLFADDGGRSICLVCKRHSRCTDDCPLRLAVEWVAANPNRCPDCGYSPMTQIFAGHETDNHFGGCPALERWKQAQRDAGATHHIKVEFDPPAPDPMSFGAGFQEFKRADEQAQRVQTAEEYARSWRKLGIWQTGQRAVVQLTPAGAGMYLFLRFLDWLRAACAPVQLAHTMDDVKRIGGAKEPT